MVSKCLKDYFGGTWHDLKSCDELQAAQVHSSSLDCLYEYWDLSAIKFGGTSRNPKGCDQPHATQGHDSGSYAPDEFWVPSRVSQMFVCFSRLLESGRAAPTPLRILRCRELPPNLLQYHFTYLVHLEASVRSLESADAACASAIADRFAPEGLQDAEHGAELLPA